MKNIGPPYDDVVEKLLAELTRMINDSWSFRPTICGKKNFTRMAKRVMNCLRKFVTEKINPLNFTTQEDLLDISNAFSKRLECVGNYTVHKTFAEYGALGQLIVVSITRLLEQKITAMCENRQNDRVSEARTYIATNYSGSNAVISVVSTSEQEIDEINVLSHGGNSKITLAKGIGFKKAITFKVRSDLVTFEETSGSTKIFQTKVTKEDKNSPVNQPTHVTFCAEFILNFVKKFYLEKTRSYREKRR